MAAPIRSHSRGYTLTELLVVTALLGVIATIAVPSVQPSREPALDAAAERVAGLLRLARHLSEAGTVEYGVEIDIAGQTARVFSRADPFTESEPNDFGVFDPVTRQPAALDFTHTDGATAVRLDAVAFDFADGSSGLVSLTFTSEGAPVRRVGSDTFDLVSGEVVLRSGNLERTVQVFPVTGGVEAS